MNASKLLLFSILFMASGSLSAQSLVGDWTMEAYTSDGTKVTNKISFKADGSMTVDFRSDGNVDVHANYSMDGDKLSISDTAEQSACYGKVGVYQVSLNGDEATIKVVDDPCDQRRGEGKPVKVKRIK
jgi:hypothetical protein